MVLIPPRRSRSKAHEYRAADPDDETGIDAEDERLYTNARALEFGDWNVRYATAVRAVLDLTLTSDQYPVITAHEASREAWMSRSPNLLTTSTNRNLFQPTGDNKRRRKTEIHQSIQEGKHRSSSRSSDQKDGIASKITRDRSASGSSRSGQSQLVDLVVEDKEAEAAERVRARKEGSSAWNQDEQKHFVRVYAADGVDECEDIREGFEPHEIPSTEPPEFAIGEDEDNEEDDGGATVQKPNYASEERNVWNSSSGS